MLWHSVSCTLRTSDGFWWETAASFDKQPLTAPFIDTCACSCSPPPIRFDSEYLLGSRNIGLLHVLIRAACVRIRPTRTTCDGGGRRGRPCRVRRPLSEERARAAIGLLGGYQGRPRRHLAIQGDLVDGIKDAHPRAALGPFICTRSGASCTILAAAGTWQQVGWDCEEASS